MSGFADTWPPAQHGVDNTDDQHQRKAGRRRPVHMKHGLRSRSLASSAPNTVPVALLGSEPRKQPVSAEGR